MGKSIFSCAAQHDVHVVNFCRREQLLKQFNYENATKHEMTNY